MRARGRGLRESTSAAPWTTPARRPRCRRPPTSSACAPVADRPDHRALRDAPDDRRAALRRRRRVGERRLAALRRRRSRSTRPRWRCSPTRGGRRRCRASRGRRRRRRSTSRSTSARRRRPRRSSTEPVLAVFRSSTAADGFFEEDGELWSARRRPAGPLAPARPARGRRAMTIDDVLPRGTGAARTPRAWPRSPERAAAAVREFSGRDLPVTGALMRVRTLGRRTFDDRPTLEAMARIGLAALVDERYARRPRRRALAVAAARRPSRGSPRPRSSAPSPSRAGCASRRPSPWSPEGGGCRVATETRIAATDDDGAPALRALLAPHRPVQLDHPPRDARRHPAQGRGMRGYLGLGSNVGDRRANLQAAVDALPGHGVIVLACSSTYDTDPVGEILDQPSFLNACARIETALAPEAAARRLQGDRARAGARPRERRPPRAAPDRRRPAAARRRALRVRAPDAAPRAGHAAALRAHPAARARLRPARPPTGRG